MYCSICGATVAQGLNFCNHCGSRLSGVKGGSLESGISDEFQMRSELKPEFLITAMIVVFVFGLAAITCLIGVMKAVLNLNGGQILAFTVLCFLIMLMVEAVCIRLLFRRNLGAEATRAQLLSKEQTTKELDASQARELPEHLPSVTEHTTRAFDPIYNERTSK
jgi:hypothetical protein